MNNQKVMLTGFCRSGTTSIAQFFERFDIPSYHQKLGPGKENMIPHGILAPPPWANEYVKKKAAQVRGSWGFESSWEFSHYMYELSLALPDVQWLILVRPPYHACNSLKAHNRRDDPIDKLAGLYIEVYKSLISQIESMKRRPMWLDFHRYISGRYVEPLFALFDIPRCDATMRLAHDHLTKKIRTAGEYKMHDSELFPEGFDLLKRLTWSCRELI